MRRQLYKACIEVAMLIVISVTCLMASIRASKEPEVEEFTHVNMVVTRDVRNTYLAEGEPQPVQLIAEEPEPIPEYPQFTYSRKAICSPESPWRRRKGRTHSPRPL